MSRLSGSRSNEPGRIAQFHDSVLAPKANKRPRAPADWPQPMQDAVNHLFNLFPHLTARHAGTLRRYVEIGQMRQREYDRLLAEDNPNPKEIVAMNSLEAKLQGLERLLCLVPSSADQSVLKADREDQAQTAPAAAAGKLKLA